MPWGTLLRAGGIALAFVPLAEHAARADPKAECIAAADQGQAHRDDGKYRRARDEFGLCSRDVCPKVIARSCGQWLHELEANQPTVVIAARDDAGTDVARATVSFDGKKIADRIDGQPLALDVGQHTLRVEREGSDAVERLVVLRAGEKNRVVDFVFAPPGAGASAAVSSEPEPEPAIEAPPHSASGSGRAVTVIALASAAAVAVGLGAYFGVDSHSQASTASGLRASLPTNACAGGASASGCQSLSDAVDAESRDATLNAVFYVAGGVLAAGALAAWFLWPRASDPPASPAKEARTWVRPSAGPKGAGLTLGASF